MGGGGDALVIKSTSRERPSRDIVATDCKLSARTNAIKLGTDSVGGFEHIRVSHVQTTKTRMAGIALYEVDGAEPRNVRTNVLKPDARPATIRIDVEGVTPADFSSTR